MTQPDMPGAIPSQSRSIRSDGDLQLFLAMLRRFAAQQGFDTTATAKITTAASELGRNILKYAGTGRLNLSRIERNGSSGIEVVAFDTGPGIADIDAAMRDHYSTGKTLGLGLPGVKRIADEFDLASTPGQGTRARFVVWKR